MKNIFPYNVRNINKGKYRIKKKLKKLCKVFFFTKMFFIFASTN